MKIKKETKQNKQNRKKNIHEIKKTIKMGGIITKNILDI